MQPEQDVVTNPFRLFFCFIAKKVLCFAQNLATLKIVCFLRTKEGGFS